MPRLAPPLWLWFTIGALYYVICFAVLYRLFARAPLLSNVGLAFGLIAGVLALNVAWTFAFFRARSLRWSSVIAIAYVPVALALLLALWRSDPTAALIFLPYVVYLAYGSYWTFEIWRLNRA